MWGGRHNPYLCTLDGWGDTFDIRFVNCHITAFFSSLQTQIRKSGAYNTKRQEYLDLVIEEFKAFDPYKLDRIWAIMFDNLRSILKNRGGNDYEPEHTRKRKSIYTNSYMYIKKSFIIQEAMNGTTTSLIVSATCPLLQPFHSSTR